MRLLIDGVEITILGILIFRLLVQLLVISSLILNVKEVLCHVRSIMLKFMDWSKKGAILITLLLSNILLISVIISQSNALSTKLEITVLAHSQKISNKRFSTMVQLLLPFLFIEISLSIKEVCIKFMPKTKDSAQNML